jgi:Uma2 family endonuclease
MGKSKQRATYDDLRKLPDHVIGELVAGELFATPRPAPRHSLAHTGIIVQVGGLFGGPPGAGGGGGGWWILTEPELHFGQDVLVPDVAGWRRDRMPVLPEGPAFELPPDWVCEVMSPSTERLDHAFKKPAYARAGIPYAWFVYPASETLEVMQLVGGRWSIIATHEGGMRVRPAPFDAMEIDLSAWWPPSPRD